MATLSVIEAEGTHFGLMVDAYEKGRKPFDPAIFQWIASFTKGTSTIVDVGCGTGRGTMGLVELVDSDTSIIGVDIDARMLEVARKKESLQSVQFLTGPIGDLPQLLPVSSQPVSIITCFSTVHWLHPSDFAVIHSTLAADGYFITIGGGGSSSTGERGHLGGLKRLIATVLQKEIVHRPAKIQDEIIAAGFVLAQTFVAEQEQCYQLTELLHEIQSYSFWIELTKEEQQQAWPHVEAAVRDHLIPEEDGIFKLSRSTRCYAYQKSSSTI